jgi:hypothetical protein
MGDMILTQVITAPQQSSFLNNFRCEGPPLHRSSTSIIIAAKDFGITDSYRKFYTNYKANESNESLGTVIGTIEGEDTYVVYLQDIENKSMDEFVEFCKWKFGQFRRVALKFLKNNVSKTLVV